MASDCFIITMFWLILLVINNFILTNTIQYNNILGNKCQTNENCTDFVLNSICFHKICICQFGYKANGRFQCVKQRRFHRQINFSKKKIY